MSKRRVRESAGADAPVPFTILMITNSNMHYDLESQNSNMHFLRYPTSDNATTIETDLVGSLYTVL